MGQKLTSVQLLMLQNQCATLAGLYAFLKATGSSQEALNALDRQINLNMEIIEKGEM